MSYSVTITAAKPFDSEEEARAWEREQVARVRELLPQLEGVQTASASTVEQPYIDLTKPA